MKLRPYQEEAADFLYAHDRAMILAPVGAGKTAITITAMSDMLRDGHVKRFLVLAPKRVAQHVWPVELEKWGPGWKLAHCVGAPARRQAALESGRVITVANYDCLQWLAKQKLDFDGIVFDELTRLKNPSGERFKALLKIIDQFKVRWGLTGSFTSNGLEDVFGQCKIIDQSLLGRSKGAFLQEYFVLMNKEYGDWAPRVGSLERVMARIKPATYLLQPGVYTDTLPPLNTVEMRCDLPTREPYEKMRKDFAVEFPEAKVLALNAAVVTGKLQQMASGFIYDTVKTPNPDSPGKWIVTQTPVWFSDHKLDLLTDILAENQRANTLLFYKYTEERDAIMRRHPEAETLDAPGAIDRWNDGKIPLLLAHPESAQYGLNLQFGGNIVIWFSLPWSLTAFEQAVGRLHRSGQTKDVWCYVLLTSKTVDEKIWAALHDKKALSQIALEALK